MKKPFIHLFWIFWGLAFGLAQAQEQNSSGVVLEELRWVDTGYLQRQRALVEEITRSEFGAPLRGDKRDLRLLQRLFDEDLIKQPELVKQQALGVVLGDVYVKELGLEWVVYKDAEGKSRAVCLPRTQHCLFPITMISKRASLGVKPNILALYDHGVSLIQEHLPKTPYKVVQ
jgi:hypothetical protein